MSTTFRIGVVLSPRGWSGRLHAFVADHVPDVELVVVRDRRAAIDAAPQVLMIDDATPWLTPALVAEAGDAGIRLVGVYDRLEAASRERLTALGLTHLIEEAMPPEDVMFLVLRLRPMADPSIEPIATATRSSASPLGGVIAVGGASGSGARELAISVAAEWGAAGISTLLIDANETTPGIARRLGLGLYPHLLTAVDRCRSDGLDGVTASLADQVTTLPFDVIVGIPTPRDWDRLVATDLDMLLESCREGWDRVVLTTSPLIEDLQRWGDRFGTSRRLLGEADVVVGCAEPTPRGVLRYLDWLADVARLRSSVVTVANKVPSSRVAAETSRQLGDVGGSLIDDVVEVPFDRAVAAAEWDGSLVARGPFRKSMHRVVALIDERLAERTAVTT